MLQLNILFFILLTLKINQSNSNIIIIANTTDTLSSNFGYLTINKIYTINSNNLKIKINNEEINWSKINSPYTYYNVYSYQINNPGKIEININFDMVDIAELFMYTVINRQNYNLKSIKMISSDTRVTNMSMTFESCYNLTSVDLSDFDISSVTSFSWTFANLKNLRYVKFGIFTTNSWCIMSYMFGSCYNLEYLDFSGFGSSNPQSKEQCLKCFIIVSLWFLLILIILILLMLII